MCVRPTHQCTICEREVIRAGAMSLAPSRIMRSEKVEIRITRCVVLLWCAQKLSRHAGFTFLPHALYQPEMPLLGFYVSETRWS